MQLSRFAKFAWALLAWNVLVVLWGAFVRATGSGAGCGNHWPLCNGAVVPLEPQIETLIELSHRLTSGVALIGVLILLIWAFRGFPKGHPVRWGAVASAFFIITESLVGAGLVLFGWVADDTSAERALVVSIHLFNTFLLLASLAVTAWWASGHQRPITLQSRGWLVWALRAGLLGVLVIGVSGAITALGDTLFPAASLAEGLRQDMDPSQHFLIQLRIWHPLVAILVGVFLLFLTRVLRSQETDATVNKLSRLLAILLVVQLGAGFVNVLLLAPVWMQITHLLLADLVWISLVLLSASVAAVRSVRLPAQQKSKWWASKTRVAPGMRRASWPSDWSRMFMVSFSLGGWAWVRGGRACRRRARPRRRLRAHPPRPCRCARGRDRPAGSCRGARP